VHRRSLARRELKKYQQPTDAATGPRNRSTP
jgi:hypothetical protein